MSSNVLLDKIKYNVKVLDEHALSIISKIEESRLTTDDKARLEIGDSAAESIDDIKELFGKVYNLSSPLREKSSAGKKNSTTLDVSSSSNKTIKFDKTSIDQVTELLAALSNGSIYKTKVDSLVTTQDYRIELEQIHKLEKLSYVYLSLIYITVMSQLTLDNTLPLSDDIAYFESVMSSNRNMLLYMLQTLPSKTFSILHTIYEEAVLKNLNMGAATEEFIVVPEWVPPSLQSSYKTFGKWLKLILNSAENSIKTLTVTPTTFLLKHGQSMRKRSHKGVYLSSVFALPFYYTARELTYKKNNLTDLRNKNVSYLGLLLKGLPTFSETKGGKPSLTEDNLNSFIDFFNKIAYPQSAKDDSITNSNTIDSSFKTLSQAFSENITKFSDSLLSKRKENCPPNTFTKYWVIITLVALYGPGFIKDIFTNTDKIYEWISLNLVETTLGFWNNWIVSPTKNILSIVRHDNNSRIAIMSQKSLGSDLDSLERMVLDYTLDNYSYIEGKELNLEDKRLLVSLISEGVKQGDMTTVMKGYEHDMKKPIKSILTGDMIRNLLIQVQKTKVDGALAMSGIDKILKSQELVFGIVAASPSCLIVYWLIKSFRNYLRTGYFMRFTKSKKIAVVQSLNNIERILTYSLNGSESDAQQGYYYEGLLFLETISLRNNGLTLVPTLRREEWIRDINDLGNSDLSVEQKIFTVRRIVNSYQIVQAS